MSNAAETDFLALTRRAAAAGAAVLAERAGRPATDTKSDGGDWVTDFDRRAEEAVREVITAARPHDVITGEEYGRTEPEHPSGTEWSIDPLDGTTNFVRGIVYYATSVAVRDDDGTWLAGAVVAPALDVEYYAGRGEGAWKATGSGEHVRLTGPDRGTDGPLIGTGFGYTPKRHVGQVAALGALMPGFANMRRLGSAALDVCMVADGTLDAYAEFGTHLHDWSAAMLIAEEAGVPVLRPDTYPAWAAAGFINFDRVRAQHIAD
ncbi:inositol monophosphatase family protein [Zhihengliuella salsuginis]|uniref:Inositol monophosphatase n=1 Tax=Zhihengliuella salsuginis TaxID=578222 RepID=A0ABQ3GI32_9MICC|nr:inositol monophosphatase family protein [Zhihengliuella salsuginis]GHD08015.1 inositol monophosphatase [Zhihengliuella salsuginis]